MTCIGVIGPGIAGLATANRLLRSGYSNITIHDRKPAIGSVWGISYPGLNVKNYKSSLATIKYTNDNNIATTICGEEDSCLIGLKHNDNKKAWEWYNDNLETEYINWKDGYPGMYLGDN